MATTRKRLQVLLTPEQYEAFMQVVHERGYESMSQLAAEILIEACGLPGYAPQRGKYSRDEIGYTQPSPVSEVKQSSFDSGMNLARMMVKNGIPLIHDDTEEDLMPPGALERFKAQKALVEDK